MSGTFAAGSNRISEAVGRGACPICAVLRHRQTSLIEECGIPDASHLCNHHAWSLARSAPALGAAEVLLQTLRSRREEGLHQGAGPCDFCEALKEEEERKLKELVGKLQMPAFLDWMRVHGMLCAHHANQISARLPAASRVAIAELLARTLCELEQDLQQYAEQAGHGNREGGGVLGRAAEFLVSQRGVPGEESPC